MEIIMKKILSFIIIFFCVVFGYAQDDITVLSLNDFHGQVEPNKDMVGAAKIASFIDDYKKTHPNLVVVAAGDNYQGTGISNISHGDVVNDFFDYIGVKYSAVGNHDFDYGQKWFKHWYEKNGIRFLAANISYKDDSLFDYFYRKYTSQDSLAYIKPFGYETLPSGKTIYFIGLATLETPESTAEKNISNLKFTDPVTSTNKWVKYINNYNRHNIPKPDTIVLLTHIPTDQQNSEVFFTKRADLGDESEIYAVVNGVDGISAVLTGHSHKFVNGIKNGVVVEQGESQGKDISVLHYDCHTSDVCKVTPEVINLAQATKNLEPNKDVNNILAKYNDSVKAELDKVITNAPRELSDEAQDGYYNIPLTYTLANIIKGQTASDLALVNSHGVRRSLPQGDITYGMIYETMPFDNMVVTLDIKGTDLLKLIEHSIQPLGDKQVGVLAGLKVSLDSAGNINDVLIDGKPLNEKQTYKLATIDFLTTGGDGFVFDNIKNYKDSNITIRDMIADYWSKNSADIAQGWQNIVVE
ncbi:5'-nucleotidase C-terminal domain-containing protein [Francisella philomiragia]|nr:5'-nucleotidase C-terminal domain-containing protein [Francisella philomiragia]MBK2278003.1 5'-nucleotidase C-terminal domain-containing protein [Francisella philomiragia]MBK2285860.1 5'-nucleotidase C-terminal domain-containing protein [Francisella philomiragia]MBK2288112.1 5'-nucleotidase C-terminal domain-containing protein [Francisella philomiragia]MBK2289818.1 5'-nucleotidase C-terminal domain-containing protein [Francisella philomiragia]